jgi:copper chaperone CopZ
MRCTVHQIPGRLRVKSPALRYHEHACRAAEAVLRTVPGVTTVSARSLTGSVVVTYDPAILDAAGLLGVLETNGWFESRRARSVDDELHEGALNAGLAVGRAALSWVFSGLVETGASAEWA